MNTGKRIKIPLPFLVIFFLSFNIQAQECPEYKACFDEGKIKFQEGFYNEALPFFGKAEEYAKLEENKEENREAANAYSWTLYKLNRNHEALERFQKLYNEIDLTRSMDKAQCRGIDTKIINNLVLVTLEVTNLENRDANFEAVHKYLEHPCAGLSEAARQEPIQDLIIKGLEFQLEKLHENAILECEKALLLDPDNNHALELKGISLYALNQFKDSVEVLEKLHDENAGTVNSTLALLKSYCALQDSMKAETLLTSSMGLLQDNKGIICADHDLFTVCTGGKISIKRNDFFCTE